MQFAATPNQSKPEATRLTKSDLAAIERGFKAAWQGKKAAGTSWQYDYGFQFAIDAIVTLRDSKQPLPYRPWRELRDHVIQDLARKGYVA